MSVPMVGKAVHGWAPGPVVIVDVYRLEGGRIVEHRDIDQDLVPAESTASVCPYVKKWLATHHDLDDAVDPMGSEHLRALY